MTMNNPSIDQQFPVYKIGQDDIPGDKIFRIARAEGATTYKADLASIPGNSRQVSPLPATPC